MELRANFRFGQAVPRAVFKAGARCCLSAVVLLALTAVLVADDDDSDTFPGLAAHYRAGSHAIVRIDPDVAFDWKLESPDPRLPRGPFSARWTGQLLIREASPFRVHALVQGKVAVAIDGRTVLAGQRTRPGWISGDAAAFSLGEKSIVVSFDSATEGATLKLFWSSDHFPLEPLPAHLLFHDRAAVPERAQILQIENGRREFEVNRCNRCHRRPELFSLAAPSLAHVGDGLSRAAIIDKISPHGPRSEFERMPTFDLNTDEAAAIAAFLLHQAEPAQLEEVPPSGKVSKEKRQGEALVRSLGCLACHSIPGRKGTLLGNGGAYGGGDLSTVGSKRSVDWLWTWLEKPDAINSDHRMPVFNLKKKERRQVVTFLETLTARDAKPATDADVAHESQTHDEALVARGRALVAQARCAACHQIKGATADFARVLDLSHPLKDWNNSCLAPRADRSRFRPAFASKERTAVIAYVNEQAGRISSEAASLRGERTFERKQCVSCHARGIHTGLGALAVAVGRDRQAAKTPVEALVPPNLAAVGDKFDDAALAEAINGGQKHRRMPWLAVHMPRFQHTEIERAALLSAFISHDRVPDGAPQSAVARTDAALAHASVESEEESRLVAGQTLVGPTGFSCIACHEMGGYVPKNVAIATHGSDLMGLGHRMRREFFLRWTRSPLRIRPGMEMPAYERPVAGLLHNDVAVQLSTLWDALNDSRFTPPTNLAAVEQFLVVRRGGPARIVRDVFAKRKGSNEAVARAFAVGFNNGHSVLLDLDMFSLRDWAVGDFARQRTSGKSWFWDLAGRQVADQFESSSDLALARQTGDGGSPILPRQEFGSAGHLESYRQVKDGVELSYQLNFDVDGKLRLLEVRETLLPLAATGGKPSGFRRQFEVARAIPGHDVLVRVPRVKFVLEHASIEPQSGETATSDGKLSRATVSRDANFLRIHCGDGAKNLAAKLDYRCLDPSVPPNSEPAAAAKLAPESVDCAPGFDGVRLPLDRSIMPTGITWTANGALAFTSLKGHVYLAHDTNGDGIEDRLDVFEEGLAAPYGLLPDGRDLIVAHKPELLRLRDVDGNGRADERTVIASGWGYSENYHDWTCGLVRDARGNFYVGLGSDYAQKSRSLESARWRGKVLRITADGAMTPIAHALRYPTGLAMDGQGRLFATDNQGDQNPFNELNHIVEGRHYGVPSLHEEKRNAPTMLPAVQIPHPWTRSVNGICFLPQSLPGATPYFQSLAGQGIGCEYNGRFLVRFSLQEVDGVVQGAVYPFSRSSEERSAATGKGRPATVGEHGFMGPLCCAVSPRGDLYIGGIQDSGWLGGTNVGEIVRLRPNNQPANGIRHIRATATGFEIAFFEPIDRPLVERTTNFKLVGYQRIWSGDYATADSGRHRLAVRKCGLSADGRTVTLTTDRPREGFVYEVSCSELAVPGREPLWPSFGYYTLHRVPKRDQ